MNREQWLMTMDCVATIAYLAVILQAVHTFPTQIPRAEVLREQSKR